jgi:hypothetical protein
MRISKSGKYRTSPTRLFVLRRYKDNPIIHLKSPSDNQAFVAFLGDVSGLITLNFLSSLNYTVNVKRKALLEYKLID